MSGRLVGEVLDHAPQDLRPAEFLTLIVLAEDARDTDRLARYSDLASLTMRTRMAPGTVRNALSELVRRGLVNPVHPNVHRGGRHQEYTIAKLDNHHRRTTIRLVNGSSHDDTSDPKRVTHE